MRGTTGGPRGPVVLLAVGLLVGATGCGALDRALGDDGDTALVADASERAEGAEPPRPVEYLTRPVDLLIGDRSDKGLRGTLVSPGGMCGFLTDGSWRAGVADGAISATGDARSVVRDSVEIIGQAPVGAEATTDGLRGYVQWQPIPAVAEVREYQGGPPVEHEGVLEVDPTGLEATFTAGPTGTDSPQPTDLVIEVACGSRTDDPG